MKIICTLVLVLFSLSVTAQEKSIDNFNKSLNYRLAKYHTERGRGLFVVLIGGGSIYYSTTFELKYKFKIDKYGNVMPAGEYYAPLKYICLYGGATIIAGGIFSFFHAERWMNKNRIVFTGDKLAYRF